MDNKFIKEKLAFTSELLTRFDFTGGLTEYYQCQKVSDSCIQVNVPINLGFSDAHLRALSISENLTIFPLVFDFFDSVVDLKCSCADEKFSKKSEIFEEKNSTSDLLFRHIESNLYKLSVKIRNKLIHNSVSFSGCGEFLNVDAKITLPISRFKLINRLVFFVSKKIMNDESYNMYEKCFIYSIYHDVFGKLDNNLPKTSDLVQVNVDVRRWYIDMTDRTISNNTKIFDLISAPEVPLWNETIEEFQARCPDPSKRVISGNYTYKFRLENDVCLIPAELIHKKKDMRLDGLSDWKISVE
jgi:hypothetical protein